jgi:hypothetical protein
VRAEHVDVERVERQHLGLQLVHVTAAPSLDSRGRDRAS